MNAYTHIITSPSATRSTATRNKHGVSLPFVPGVSQVEPAPEPERKVTQMPTTFRANATPKDAPAPVHKPHKFYTEKRIGETEEEWIARDWSLRVADEKPPTFVVLHRDPNQSAEAGRKAAALRKAAPEYEARRKVICDAIAPGGSTCGDIMQKIGALSRGALNEVLRGMVADGRLKRTKLKNEHVYTVATMKEASQ